MFGRFKQNQQPTPEAPAIVGELSLEPEVIHKARPQDSNTMTPDELEANQREQKRLDKLMDVRMEVHKRLLETLNLSAIDQASEADLRREIGAIARESIHELGVVLNGQDQKELLQDLMDEVKGLGPIQPLLRDETVNDILINGPHQV
ncbi:MAG TPA: CpaF family protein, partial [Rhodobacteraceae bacterium]|nr:CpaF family protein [Paracoccaceae bacterium]